MLRACRNLIDNMMWLNPGRTQYMYVVWTLNPKRRDSLMKFSTFGAHVKTRESSMAIQSISWSFSKNFTSSQCHGRKMPRYSWIVLPVVLGGISGFLCMKATLLFKSCLNARKTDVASKMIGCWMVLDIPALPNVVVGAVEEKQN